MRSIKASAAMLVQTKLSTGDEIGTNGFDRVGIILLMLGTVFHRSVCIDVWLLT